MNSSKQPEALLLVSPGCQYCRGMHEALDELAASKKLSKLTVVDISEQPQIAEQLGVRSVPWLRINDFVLQGAHTPGELNKWIEASKQENGWSQYLDHLLDTGGLVLAERLIKEKPERLSALLPLASDPESSMHVRVGIAAILEEFHDSSRKRKLIPALAEIAKSDDVKVRADACHYLALTGSEEAITVLQNYRSDKNEMVREIANEGILELQKTGEAH